MLLAGGQVLWAERIGPSSRRTALTFSEILQNPDPSTPGGGSEFVELYNGDLVPVSLKGFRLEGSVRFVFPADTLLEPGAVLVVARDPAALRSRVPGKALLGPYEGALSGAAFHLELHDEFGALLLETRFDPNLLPPDAAEATGRSLVLSRPSFGEGTPRAWGWSESVGGSPGQLDLIVEPAPPALRAAEPPVRPAPVVIHEILFHPVTGSNREQFIELYNRTDQELSLAGWRLAGAVEFAFPRSARLPPRGYLVVARDARELRRSHAVLNRRNCLGDFSGVLNHSGGVLRLEQPAAGRNAWEVVHEAHYRVGGRWGVWSDGGGSSLELIHPEADARRADSWRDSDESAKAPWTTISFQGRVGHGIALGAGTSLHLYLLGEGECLVDDVEVRVEGGTNRVSNPGFESGLAGWRAMGAMDLSSVESESGENPAHGHVLHLRAGSRGDPGANKVVSDAFAPVGEGHLVTIRCRARWLRGWPEMLLRLQGGGAEAAGRLTLPVDPGTPGRPNSTAAAFAGPALWEVRHDPPVPKAGEPVRVSVSVESGRPLKHVLLRYRVDPGTSWTEIPMRSGAAGGRFTAVLPGQPDGTLVAFHLVAVGADGATNTFPRRVFPEAPLPRLFPGDALSHECLVRFGDPRIPGALATYRLWMTRANRDRWIARDRLSNADLDATLVYDDQRVIYNVGAQAAGSPWHVDQMAPGPDGSNRFDYVVHLPKDEPLLGETDLNLVIPGNGDGPSSSDLSALSEPVSLLLFRDLGLPSLHRRFIRLVVNGSERSSVAGLKGHFVYEDVQQPNSHALRGWFPGAGHGTLFKIEDWFEFTNTVATVFENKGADLLRRVIPGTTNLSTAPYRFMWRLRGVHAGESASDYSGLFELIDAMSPTLDPAADVDVERVMRVADLDQWFRVIACQRALGNWDSYGWDRGKNCYLFRPRGGRFVLVPWDVDATLALGGKEPDSSWFEVSDPRLASALRVPRVRRSYLRSLQEVLDGPYREGRLEALFDERTQALHAAGVTTDSQLTIANKAYLKARRAHLRAELARHAASFTAVLDPQTGTTTSPRTLHGTAPLAVESIRVHGRPLEIHWKSVTEWAAEVPFEPTNGAREAPVECIGFDRFGAPVPQARIVLRW